MNPQTCVCVYGTAPHLRTAGRAQSGRHPCRRTSTRRPALATVPRHIRSRRAPPRRHPARRLSVPPPQHADHPVSFSFDRKGVQPWPHPSKQQAGRHARARTGRQTGHQPARTPHTQTQAHRQRARLDETRLRVLFYPRHIRPGCPPRTAYPPAAPPAACTAPPRFPPAPPPPSSSSSSPTQTLRKTGRALPANERGGKQDGAEQSKFSSRGINGESRALIAILHQYTQAPSILTTIVFSLAC